MSAENATSTLRDAHRDFTRSRILEAALDLLRENPEGLTIAGVAVRAGVTERTIYRHFPTREALMAAVWRRINETVMTTEFLDTPEGVIGQPRQMFPEFDAQEKLMRAIVSSREGAELRLAPNAARQAAFRKAVRAARPDLKEPHFTRLCAAVQLLDSSFAWAVMKDYWGLDGAEAGAAASEAIAALLAPPPRPPRKTSPEESP